VQLSTLFQQAKQDTTIKAVLLTGEGRGFCAGADIKQLQDLNSVTGLAFARFGQHVFRELELLGKPSLAAIHGFAFGGGCELAMSASLRMAADNAVFGQPEIKLGVIPGFGGTQRLARLIGKGRALEICLTGRKFTADEALRWGFLNEVTPADQLLSRANSILESLTQLAPFAQQSILSAIHFGYDLSLEEAFEMEATQFGLCCTTADKQEGVAAFLEKRIATFTGA
jgi:enoyl-CoA hydratase